MKRIVSMLLVAVMVLSALPLQVFAVTYSYVSGSSSNATITIQNEKGVRITDATVTVKRNSDNYQVQHIGNGQYQFTRNSFSVFTTYNITVVRDGYVTQTVSINGGTSNTLVTLVSDGPEDEFAQFRVYYIADGTVPSSYAGYGNAIDYGPSADNTPLVLINVNLTKLIEISVQENSPVVYNQSGSTASNNQYEFIPAGSRTDADYMEKVSNFWQAVLSCTDEESIAAFEETGLFENYMSYCLKKQEDGSQHSDGVLAVTPPVYVVELYQNEVFFGGGVTDSAENSKFLTAYDILDQYEAHLKQTITWQEDGYGKPLCQEKADGTEYYTGTYVDPATNKIHNIEVFQFDAAGAVEVEGSEIPYVRRTETYYLAKYNMSVDAGTPIQYLVTYTDGVPGEVVFTEHEYATYKNEIVPAYTGITVREDYIFMGWYLEGDSAGKVYTDADIAEMKVTGNMTFHAVWTPVPKYTGTVKIVLDGTYDAATQTLLTGTLIDPNVLLHTQDHIHLYVSADGEEFIQLNHDSVGSFSAELENGTYSIYYAHENSTDYVLASDQVLIMENMDRTRYLFFNSVTYDPKGGTLDGTAENRVEYYHSGFSVNVYGTVPVREGYIFTGWKSDYGLDFQPGELLNSKLDHAVYLSAQWIKASDVYVHVTVDHTAEEGGTNNETAMHDVTFTIDSRTGDQGDYTELYSKSIVWDGKTPYTGTDYRYECSSTDDAHITHYTALQPNLTGVPADDHYTVSSHKTGYVIKSVTQQTDENGDLHIYVEFIYDPHTFDFTYYVELDEEAKSLDSGLWPKAVNVKVTCWAEPYGEDHAAGEGYDWQTISQQQYTYERVVLDANGEGMGTYPVWTLSSDGEQYYYRIEVVSYELQDGTIVLAYDDEEPNVTYVSANKRYFADIEVTGGKAPAGSALTGAWYENGVQQGTVKAIVSIPAYTVTFVPNGGTLNGTTENTVEEKQIIVPVLENYIPVRDGGYIFEGWHLADENGNMTEEHVLSNSPLTSDITLIAQWRDPIKVEGIITAGGAYEQVNEDGSVTIQYIYDHDLLQNVTVLLQKKLPSGYYETVQQTHVALDYTNEEYYFQKTSELTVPVGVGFYSFESLPDDGTQYRIFVLNANYSAHYQNEPESATADRLKYNTYAEFDYDALLGETEPKTATVNAHMHFTPPSYDLHFKLDATAIGEGFRPDSGEILITCDNDPAITEPDQWDVISQMIFGDEFRGAQLQLENGVAYGSDSVWKYSYDGSTLYDYGIRLDSLTTDGVETPYGENPCFEVTYQAPAHFVVATGAQSQLLVATLTPKTYKINYVLGGGTMTGSYPTTHTWSFETALSDVVPYRTGYEFAGWYTDEALTQPLTSDTIAADVHEDVTFYAKWNRVNIHLQVVIDHRAADGGLATNYDDLLHVQLTELDGTDYLPVAGYDKSYDQSYWHTRGDEVEWDILEVPYIFYGLPMDGQYNMDVSMEHYDPVDSLEVINAQGQTETVTAGVTSYVTEDGSTTVVNYYVVACLKFSPDLEELGKVIFHANNAEAQCFDRETGEDVFRTYYPAGFGTEFSLNVDGTVSTFYDIPTFEYLTHNEYVFAGWYTEPDEEGQPMSWEQVYDLSQGDEIHLYAHWLETGTVAQEEDGKASVGSYNGFDLIGTQIRTYVKDDEEHHGDMDSGLRFITVLSEELWNGIMELSAQNTAAAQYGFLLCKDSTASNYADPTDPDYQLQYKATNSNGQDTTQSYAYLNNVKCDGVTDHFNGVGYRLYTMVVTFKNLEGAALEAALEQQLIARSYLGYYDANGLYRYYYNNFIGDSVYHGCRSSYADTLENQ